MTNLALFCQLQYSTQNYLELVGRLQDHADVIEDIKNDFESQGLLSNSMEGLQNQLEETTVSDFHISRSKFSLLSHISAPWLSVFACAGSSHSFIPVLVLTEAMLSLSSH